MRLRKLRMLKWTLHYLTFGWYPKPNMVADFFGATINDSNKKFSDVMPEPQQARQNPQERSVAWLMENFGND